MITKVEPFMDDFNDGNYTGWTTAGFVATNTMMVDSNTDATVDTISKDDFTDDDHEIRFSYRRTSSNSGDRVSVYARFVDWDNYVRVEFFANNTCRVLEKVNGTATIIATGTAASTTNTWYDVRIVCDDTSVKAYHKTGQNLESQVLSATSAVTTSSKVAIVTWSNTTADLDNIWLIGDSLNNTTTFAVNNANELTTMTDPNGTTSFGFDAWGRMTSKARALNRATFDFNYDSLLTEYTTTFPDEASVSFEYDAHRLLRQRTAASSTRHFRWFGDYLLTSEDTNGELIATNIEGYLGQVSGNDPSLGSYRYSGLDVLTSPRRLRDSNKSIVAIHEYDPFGLTHSSFGETLFYGFSGLIPNPGLKLYYAPFRSLMPDSGRWLTPDPLHMIDGLNMYLYVHANPVVGIDYLGLSELFNDASLAGAFCNGALDGAMQAWDTIVWPTFTECYNPNDPGMRAGAAAATVADFAMPTGRCKGAAKGLGAVARKAGGSGKPRQLIILLPNRKCAEEAARKAGKGRTPVHHPRTKTDPTAPPHFHPTCKDGSVLKDGSHYCYPGLRPKTVRK